MSETTLIHDPSTNVPDYAAEETGRLAREYAGLEKDVSALLVEARALPERVDDEATANDFTAAISRFKDLNDKIEGLRAMEKLPHLRKGDAVQGFFKRLAGRLLREKKTDPAGGGDVLAARLHDYNERRLAEEQRKRDEAARAAKAEEERLAALRRKAEAEQREAEERAARARKEANKEAAEKAAREAEAAARVLRDQEEMARSQSAETSAAASAKPADLVRERHSGGSMNTMKRVGFAEITDEMQLDIVALWPFVKSDAKLAALQAWAKVTQHRQQMKGAVVGFRNETVVRR
jgi:hypothetical protein